MSRRSRLGLFGVSSAILATLFLWALTGLPNFGAFQGQYGRILNSTAGTERHVTNVVASIVFDYRGFDTLGEEFILFAAVMSVALLLRDVRSQDARGSDDVRSDVVRAVGLFAVGPASTLPREPAPGHTSPSGSPRCSRARRISRTWSSSASEGRSRPAERSRSSTLRPASR